MTLKYTGSVSAVDMACSARVKRTARRETRQRKQSGAEADLVLFAAATRQVHRIVQLHDEQQHVRDENSDCAPVEIETVA
jgi:hypothetical protein